MSIFKKATKLLASMGSSKAMDRLPVETAIDEKTLNIGGDKIAESKEGQLWVGLQELTGYYFLETTIVSVINIKTFEGGKLYFTSDNGDFELSSDTLEIKSEFSNVSNRFMVQVSFDIVKTEIDRISKGDFSTIKFSFKKKSITFNKVIPD